MLLEIKVTPNARKFALSFRDCWRISVISPPKKGKANLEVMSELSRLLSCPVRVVKGASGRRKLLEVDLDEDEFKRRTEAYLKAQESPKSH
ncbi:MAG: DUF167 domain-containing protein [Candidatus Micrarchaeota archaeon]